MLNAPPGRIEDYMLDHFMIVTLTRDAVIAGNVEPVLTPLELFAAYDYAGVEGSAWRPWLARLQQEAQLTATARSLELAAVGVATMARTCGECHQALGHNPVPVYEDLEAPPSTKLTNGLEARMRRHIWAVDALWAGLIEPSDSAWHAGAAALARMPESAPVDAPQVKDRRTAAWQSMRQLGDLAEEASGLAERANVYGTLLASCAACHARQWDSDD